MGFMLSFKQNCPRSKTLATFLLNIYEIQLILTLLIKFDVVLYDDAVKFIFHQSHGPTSIIGFIIVFLNITVMALTVHQGNIQFKSKFYSKTLHKWTVSFIKISPYILFIPLMMYSLSTFKNQELVYKILSVINILFFVVFYELNEISNWAYRFIEVDFCNQRGSNQIGFAMTVVYLIVLELFSPLYASVIYFFRGLLKLIHLFYHYDFQLIQKVDLFYGMYSVFMFGLVIGTHFFEINILKQIRQVSILGIFAVLICYKGISPILNQLNYSRIKNSSLITLIDKDQRQSSSQNLSQTMQQSQNVLRILTSIYLQKQKQKQSQKNSFSKWWQVYNRVILIHRIQCQRPKCFCKGGKYQVEKVQLMIYIAQLLNLGDSLCQLNTKMYNLKIMLIYLFIEIAKKPLKAYYQIMRLKQEKISSDTQIQLEYLIKQTRECFDQVFLKNKAKNQELQLIKVIAYEELMIQLGKNMEDIIDDVINFHELFQYSTIKTSSIKSQSASIFKKKKLLQQQVYNVILNYSQNSRLNLIVYVFYKNLEVYKSKQADLKKLSSQQLLKRRIYQKKEINIFSEEYGSIYIDLIQERGKIINLTKNIGDFFGYARDQMQGFNIRRFMPGIFARYHDKFLSNFIQKGKIKLLREKERVIFAKNKKKFIFPVNVRLKAEYLLQNQFGASSLINGIQTNSQFMMVNSNGKLQQITQNLYKRLFGTIFRDQVCKCNRLSIFKLLPSLNRIHDPSQQKFQSSNKIYDGILIYSHHQEVLNEKFRYARDLSNNNQSTIGSKSATANSSSKMSIMSATNTASHFAQQSQIMDFLLQSFKTFLVDINIFKLKGLKVSYKLSTVRTSEFQLTMIEFITIQPIEGSLFYSSLLDELKNVAQIYQLNQQHGPIMTHLNQFQTVIKENRCQEYALITNTNKQKKFDFTNSQYEAQVQRKRQTLHRNQALEYEEFLQLHPQNSEDSFADEQIQKRNQGLQDFERSEQSSMIGSMQSQSKKQILINAFNCKDSVISKNIIGAIKCTIAGLILLLMLLSFFSMSFISSNQQLWSDIKQVFTTNQAVSFKIALHQVQIFQRSFSPNSKVSEFIKQKKLLSIDKLRVNLQQINKNTIDKSLKNNFYTKQIEMYDAVTKISVVTTLAQFLNRYLYMLMYESQQNIQHLRNNYGSMNMAFEELQDQKIKYIEKQSKFNFYRIVALVVIYVGILFIGLLLIIPVYTHYKRQENNVVGLLSFMSVKEIKKSINKLKQVRDLLKSKQNSINMFEALCEETNNERNRVQKDKSQEMELKNVNRAIKITSEHDQSFSLKITKLICVLILLIIVLSNFAVASFYIIYNAQLFFDSNIHATWLSFRFQNKSPLLVNTLMSNVNRFVQSKPLLTYPPQVTHQGSFQFFTPLQQLSKQSYQRSPISKLLKQMFSSQLCNGVINCPSSTGNTYKKSNTISFQYLIYQFKDRFAILMPDGKYVLDAQSIQNWIKQNKIENFILWMEEIMTMANMINDETDEQFEQEQKNFELKLLICSFILIPFSIALLILIQSKFLTYLNSMLVESEEIFRHFSVTVLIENTYLTSYFNSKIKQSK